jgi:hypothetical protein
MKTELEWEFLGVWPLLGVCPLNGDYYIFQWRTYCRQFLITGSFQGDGKPVFDCYARAISSWDEIKRGWSSLERAKDCINRYYRGDLTEHL